MTAAPVPTLGTTFDCLEWDHQRLDALLADARAGIARGESRGITFRAFRLGLERHCRIEEELLFPAFERDGGSRAAGATSVLRFEHELLRARVAEMDEALASGDLARFHGAGAKLDAILAAHNVKEERVLYPGVDRVLSDDERRALVAALRAG
jgi:iron-sulfur cluster repair protein YtfE (RIC family)